MNDVGSKHIAWFLPIAYLFHLADEYFTGFPRWFSEVLKTDLSLNDFLIVNSIGFSTTIIITLLYTFNKTTGFIIAALGILFFVNGVVHIAATIFTLSYSPGTISGLLLYLPLGYLVYKKIFPLLPEQQRIISILVGMVIQIGIALLVLNI